MRRSGIFSILFLFILAVAAHPQSDDPRKLREELQVELKQLQRTLGVTTLLVTHDQDEALSLSDRIMVLNHGKTQQVAAPAEAYLKPANRFVAGFLGAPRMNFLDGVVAGRSEAGIRLRLADGSEVDVPAAPAGYLYGAIVDFVSQHKLTALGMTPVALGYRLSFLVCGLFILSGIAVAVTLLPKQPRPPE